MFGDERSQFMAFYMNAFVLIPKAYEIIRRLPKNLNSRTDIYANDVSSLEKLKTILELWIVDIPFDIETIYAAIVCDGGQVIEKSDEEKVPKNLSRF